MTAGGLVVQSHRRPLPAPWLQRCLDTVQAWAMSRGFAYRFLDDELFDVLDEDLLARCAQRRVVATDLARLVWLQRALDQGYDPVIWCDADVLVFGPDRLVLPDEPFAVGREIWVDEVRGRPKARRHVHNAVLLFRRGNPFLSFYRYAAERMVRAHDGPMVPQFVGPKLLTALHNLVRVPVIETANLMSPPVLRDVAVGGGPFLEAWLARCDEIPAAANLCGSRVDGEELTNRLVERAVDRLLLCPTL